MKTLVLLLILPLTLTAQVHSVHAQKLRVELTPSMLTNEASVGDPSGIVDEQRQIIGAPAGQPKTTWQLNSQYWKQFPFSAFLDLGEKRHLASIWIFDTNGKGDVVISAGQPEQWREVATYDCAAYLAWAEIELDVETRYLRVTRKTPGANFSEIAVYEYTVEAARERKARKGERDQLEAERNTALKHARAEALKRPLVEMTPYGKLSLVDEIICADDGHEHDFNEFPAKASNIATILGRRTRVLPPKKDQAAYLSYRIGKMKLLRPGGTYVLAVDYPEDTPRSMVIINTGNETSRGFHTGTTVGDAFHSKYVNSLPESIDVPLSGKWETWTLLFQLHDRFPTKGLVRGPQPRELTPEDGFDVTIAQFSAKNMPMSQGAAVSRIRLFEVVNPDELTQPLSFPPSDLPRRHLFWREEMADGIIDLKSDHPGIANPIDWYRYKANRMHFLGMNTYSKDLLEFGACQHWDSTPYGGHDWVFHDPTTKELWPEIVTLMGEYGFDILAYYEYSGSKGYHGLGKERRARPLTRDDAYTHTQWTESENADLTDPDTYADFQKMLDLTVIRLRGKARFAGIWIRSRGQMPVSFSDPTLSRFASQMEIDGGPVTRQRLRNDQDLYDQYIEWWHIKRKEFLIAMRDYLQEKGIKNPTVLFTGCVTEPGIGFHTWTPHLITNRPELWKSVLQQPDHAGVSHGSIATLTGPQVVEKSLYLKALTSPGLNWGNWEIQHSRPADDPQNYRNESNVMLTLPFNRNYTVASPATLDEYRTTSGLALIRHYALNEHMMFDQQDNSILGYFVADIERTGPYCMMAEAHAMANGDPTMIGYLVGCNFGRGFPKYVRNFNANYLALPALPSQLVRQASSDREVVVRRIDTQQHGIWMAVVNTSLDGKKGVSVMFPAGKITDAVSGQPIRTSGRKISLTMYPCQLRSFRVQ